ncbi:glycerophosphodiester phosphodiesterase [Flindersiella endophytica]
MRIFTLFVLVAAGLTVASQTASADSSCAIPPPVAHRGGTERHTENSLDAYRDASRAGVLVWETDVRFDRRDVPILMHDATLDRTTTGRGEVAELDVAATAIRLNDGQPIPTFRRFLSLAKQHGAYAFVEFKTEPTRAQLGAVMRVINRLGMRSGVLLNSFDAGRLQRIRAAVGDDVDYSWVANGGTQSARDVRAVGRSFNKAAKHLTRQQLDAYLAAGIRTYAWTVDDSGQWQALRTWPLAGIVTNRPVAYAAWRNGRC